MRRCIAPELIRNDARAASLTALASTFIGLRSAAAHGVAAVHAFVAGAAANGDGAADVAGGGVGLHFGALLAEGVGDDLDAEVDAARIGGGGAVAGLAG